jgi:hypothetical protein
MFSWLSKIVTSSKNQARAVRYRQLALAEPDRAKADVLLKLADEADREVLCTSDWLFEKSKVKQSSRSRPNSSGFFNHACAYWPDAEADKTFRARSSTGPPPISWMVFNGRADMECQVLDISPHGAKVVARIPSEVPTRFELAFFNDERKRRVCEVIWRRGKMLGVKFMQ